MCGSQVEVDCTGTAECYGYAWQTITIECTKEKDKFCGMKLELTADMSYAENAYHTLIDTWNKIGRRYPMDFNRS